MNWTRNLTLLILFVGSASLCAVASAATFSNPIAGVGPDPWVVQWRGDYYSCSTLGDIKVSKSARLQDIGTQPKTTIWPLAPGQPYSAGIWAPEIHFLEGKWYIYFAASDGPNENHRMFVLKSKTEDPQGEYEPPVKVADSTNKWAIDGTVLNLAGQLYFIWSGWAGDDNGRQDLYIAPMSNPWTISGNRVLIARPEYAWEKIHWPEVNEGPQIVERNGEIHIIYSASGSWTDDYCLGRVTLTGSDPLDANSWTKHNVPVFYRTMHVFGPGHASFVKSLDQSEDWIVYHAAKSQGSGWDRDIRIQQFHWFSDDTPDFGLPVLVGGHLTEPSGSPFGVTYEAEDAVISNALVASNSGASDEEKVGHIDYSNSYVEFLVTVQQAGEYRLHVRYGTDFGAASHLLSVNGVFSQELNYAQTGWDNWRFHSDAIVTLSAGSNTIRLGTGNEYAELDFIGVTTGPEGDIDADGLPDSWEREHFGHLNDPNGAPEVDGDGMSTQDEYSADTTPNNRESVLQITGIEVSSTGTTVSWQGGIQATQYVERSNDLVAQDWETIKTINPPTSEIGTWEDDEMTVQGRQFYRLRASR